MLYVAHGTVQRFKRRNPLNWAALFFLVFAFAASSSASPRAASEAMVIGVTATMTVADLRVALGGVGEVACLVLWGKSVPRAGRPIRIEWNGDYLEGRLRCGADANRALSQAPQRRDGVILYWEPEEKLFSIGHPSGPGRVPLRPPLPAREALTAYWFGENDPERCHTIATTPAVEFLSALKKIVPGFARIAFPGLTPEQGACPCSFDGSFAERPAETPWRPLAWVEIATTRPWKQVGTRWVACGSAQRTVRIVGPAGWTPIGEYAHNDSITALAGNDAILFHNKVWLRGRAESIFDVPLSDYVSGDGARIGRLECAGGPYSECTLLHLLERDPHGQVLRDWKVPVTPRQYLPEGYSADGFLLVRYPESYDHWVLGRVERQRVVKLEPLPSDGAAWSGVFDRHLRWCPTIVEPQAHH